MFLEPYFYNPYFNEYFIRGIPNTGVFKINGIDRTEFLLAGTYQISENLNNRNTANWRMSIKPKEDFRPQVGQEVVFESRLCATDPYHREFAGVITSIKYKQATCESVLKLDCEASDFNHTLDRRVAYNIYQPQNVRDVIVSIVERYLEGEDITPDEVNVPAIQLEKFIIPYIPVSRAFDEISKATGLFYYVDYFKRLHFFLRSEKTAEWSIKSTCGQDIEFCAVISATGCPDVGIKFGKLGVRETDSKLGNEYFVVAGKGVTKDQKTRNFIGNGVLTTFDLPYPVYEMIDVKVNGVSVPFGDRDDADPLAEWYWTKGEIQISQRESDPPLTSGQTLTVIFYGMYNVVANRKDDASIARMKSIMKFGTGKFQRVHQDENIESFQYAEQYARGLLTRYSQVPVILEFTTDRFRPQVGEMFSAELPEFGVRKLSQGSDFLVESVDIENIDGYFNRYKVRASSIGYQGGWQDFYKALEKAGKTPKLSKKTEITFVFDQQEQVCFEVSLTVGDITDLKPHCPCYDPKFAVGCGRVGAFQIGRPEYRKWQ